MITDQTRGKFLAALDNAPFEITEWEAGFVASYLKRTDKDQVSFSAQQRAIIDCGRQR